MAKRFDTFRALCELTPGDIGILAATLDDARRDGLGDDDTCDQLESAILWDCGIDLSHEDVPSSGPRLLPASTASEIIPPPIIGGPAPRLRGRKARDPRAPRLGK